VNKRLKSQKKPYKGVMVKIEKDKSKDGEYRVDKKKFIADA
jgi:hypothetical protein